MERITLFMDFYDLDSKNSEDVYLQSLIVKEDVKRRTKSSTTSEVYTQTKDFIPLLRKDARDVFGGM